MKIRSLGDFAWLVGVDLVGLYIAQWLGLITIH